MTWCVCEGEGGRDGGREEGRKGGREEGRKGGRERERSLSGEREEFVRELYAGRRPRGKEGDVRNPAQVGFGVLGCRV